MRLRRLLCNLELAGLVGGFAFACSGPTNPGELPPLAHPDHVQPLLDPKNPQPVPGARHIPSLDASAPTTSAPATSRSTSPTTSPTTDLAPVQFRSDRSPPTGVPSSDPPHDAGVHDAVELPPLPDALPPDASKRAESTSFNCC